MITGDCNFTSTDQEADMLREKGFKSLSDSSTNIHGWDVDHVWAKEPLKNKVLMYSESDHRPVQSCVKRGGGSGESINIGIVIAVTIVCVLLMIIFGLFDGNKKETSSSIYAMLEKVFS